MPGELEPWLDIGHAIYSVIPPELEISDIAQRMLSGDQRVVSQSSGWRIGTDVVLAGCITIPSFPETPATHKKAVSAHVVPPYDGFIGSRASSPVRIVPRPSI